MIKNKVIIIAEIGVNHNGKVNIAKKLIMAAKKSGANYVKFHNWKAEDLVTNGANMAPYQIKNAKKKMTQIEMLRPLELSNDKIYLLKKFSEKNKINFLSSPFDEKNFLYLSNFLKCKLIKIPSGEINNYLMLSKSDLKKHKLIISTGMSNLKEIAETVNFIAKTKIFKILNDNIRIINKKKHQYIKNRIYILHCVTDYPVADQFANLSCIKTLKDKLQLNIGYSDHTLGVVAPLIAVALGAQIIEKHITLNNKMKGPDHRASLNPTEFKKMCSYIRKYELMMGNGVKKIQKCEIQNFKIARKSIYARTFIKKGDLFTLKNLSVKRPAEGISPNKYFKVVGKKSNKNYKIDQLIKI